MTKAKTSKVKPTGFDRYFAELMKDPKFARAYREARAKLAKKKPTKAMRDLMAGKPPSKSVAAAAKKAGL